MTISAEAGIWLLKVIASGLVGAAVGSFAASASLRAAKGQSYISGRSRCDHCLRQLSWLETVPVAGYALSSGKCRTCDGPIARLHLVGEIVGASILSVTVARTAGLEMWILLPLFACLLISSFIDARTMRLPDGLTAAIGVCALLLAWQRQSLLVGVLAAFCVGAILFGLKTWLEKHRGQAMLGLGDVKLSAALALALGVSTPAMLALAAIAGLGFILIRREKGPVAFGPMIAGATWLIVVFVPEAYFR